MNESDVLVQYNRLARHHQTALEQKDDISFLDMTHCLRIWVDMKEGIDNLAEQKGVSLKFTHTTTPKSIGKMFRGSNFMHLPLGSGVDSPGGKIRGMTISTNRGLTPEEEKKIFETGVPKAHSTTLRFSEWLASNVYEVSSPDKKHSHLWITREILITRVANILGASHPAGSEGGDKREKKFDAYILELNKTILVGYPAAYYQLLEIAGDILVAMKVLFEPTA